MKKVLINFMVFTGVFALSFVNSCDILEELFINLAVSRVVETDHTDDDYTSNTESWCFETDSETYMEYRDDIESMEFLEASFIVLEYNPDPDLRGDLTVTVKTGQGITLWSETFPNVNPGDYMDAPYTFTLNENEIQLVNQVLSALHNICFVVTLEVANMEPSAATNKFVKGRVDIAIEARATIN